MSAGAPALLARNHRLTRTRRGHSLRSEINSLSRRFRAVYAQLLAQRQDVAKLPRGAEWLLDNDYVVQGAIRIVRKSLPTHFMRQLPASVSSRHTFVRELCDYVLDEGGSPLDIDWLAEALNQYQSETTLTTGELWALPALLRLTILLRLVGETERLLENKPDARGHRTAIASLVVSLRTLETTNWLEFVERVSAADDALREDPAGCYPLMDKDTRNRYRQEVESLARWANTDEVTVVRQANALAMKGSGEREGHVGYYRIKALLRHIEHPRTMFRESP